MPVTGRSVRHPKAALLHGLQEAGEDVAEQRDEIVFLELRVRRRPLEEVEGYEQHQLVVPVSEMVFVSPCHSPERPDSVPCVLRPFPVGVARKKAIGGIG